MEDLNPVPPLIPPRSLALPLGAAPEPLGTRPEELEPIASVVGVAEAILRQPRRVMYQVRQAGSVRLIMGMVLLIALCSLGYGVVVGSFSSGAQLWAAPAKICGGLLISALICLPSLYIFTCLSGSQARLVEICGLMAGFLLLSTILLIGFAPVAWIFSQSTGSVAWMGALHLLFWFTSLCFGLRFLNHAFSHSQARSKVGLNLWMILFALVAMQMTTALRPILGTAKTFLPADKEFFLQHWSDCLRAPAQGPSAQQTN